MTNKVDQPTAEAKPLVRQRMGGLALHAAHKARAELDAPRYSPTRPERFLPGMVVVGRTLNAAGSTEHRPVLLVGATEDRPPTWRAMGLTLASTFGDGNPRLPLLDWKAIGLHEQGYLWGPRLVYLPETDLDSLVGYMTMRDLAQVARYSTLTASERTVLSWSAVDRPSTTTAPPPKQEGRV